MYPSNHHDIFVLILFSLNLFCVPLFGEAPRWEFESTGD